MRLGFINGGRSHHRKFDGRLEHHQAVEILDVPRKLRAIQAIRDKNTADALRGTANPFQILVGEIVEAIDHHGLRVIIIDDKVGLGLTELLIHQVKTRVCLMKIIGEGLGDGAQSQPQPLDPDDIEKYDKVLIEPTVDEFHRALTHLEHLAV